MLRMFIANMTSFYMFLHFQVRQQVLLIRLQQIVLVPSLRSFRVDVVGLRVLV